MNADLKKRWLDALRSGDYAQTKAKLCRIHGNAFAPAGYCCLGVLAEIDGMLREPEPGESYETKYLRDKNHESGVLSLAYSLKIGLHNADAQMLMTMNDGDDGDNYSCTPSASFLEIADWIEKNIGDD